MTRFSVSSVSSRPPPNQGMRSRLPTETRACLRGVAPKRPGATRGAQSVEATAKHQQTVTDAVADIVPRLQEFAFAIVSAIVKQMGHHSCHDMVLELRKVGRRCLRQYSCELKSRNYPINLLLMRSGCAGLFQIVPRKSKHWPGQLGAVAETTTKRKPELIIRGHQRANASKVRGCLRRPAGAPAVSMPQAKATPNAAPKAAPKAAA